MEVAYPPGAAIMNSWQPPAEGVSDPYGESGRGRRSTMTDTIGLYLYDEVEVLDFAGPFEVFSTA
jgi:hypothetical protein